MTPFIRLHPNDDVLIARSQLVGGTQCENVTIRGLIPPGHKVALRDIAPGQPVRRYNQIIGFASKPIAAGEHVHTHNLGVGPNGGDFARDYAFGADAKPPTVPREAMFKGDRYATSVTARITNSRDRRVLGRRIEIQPKIFSSCGHWSESERAKYVVGFVVRRGGGLGLVPVTYRSKQYRTPAEDRSEGITGPLWLGRK